jgi:hypothetical protein
MSFVSTETDQWLSIIKIYDILGGSQMDKNPEDSWISL